MAVVHYNPENILKRMNFSLIKREREESADLPDSGQSEPAE